MTLSPTRPTQRREARRPRRAALRRRLLAGAHARAGVRPAAPPSTSPTSHPSSHDRAVRNARWLHLAPALAPVVTRAFQRLDYDPALEVDDAWQAAFEVFASLWARWHGRGDLLGYLLGGRRFEHALVRALAQAAASPPRNRRLPLLDAEWLAAPDQLAVADIQTELARLTPTERRALALVAAGYRIEEIAERLGRSPRTTRRLLTAIRHTLSGVFPGTSAPYPLPSP